jgi:fumarate reductase subunit C
MNTVTSDKSKLYYPKMPAMWWLTKRAYFLFMLREISSVFIAIFLVVLLIEMYQLSRGPAAYAGFLQRLTSPGWIIFHVVAWLFALYHSFTWFSLTSKVQVVRVGGRQVPPPLVTAVNVGIWIVLSVVILFVFLFV